MPTKANSFDATGIGFASTLTPAGRSAVAVIALAVDADAEFESLLDSLFRPVGSKQFSELRHKNVVYGVWCSTGEDLLLVRCGNQSPVPFTGVSIGDDKREYYEIQCHGGRIAVESVLSALEKIGIQQLDRKSFSNQLVDRWQSEALSALTLAETQRVTFWLMRNLELLSEFLSNAKALLDSCKFHSGSESKLSEQAIAMIEDALHWQEFGRHLTLPRQVVLWGRPNVGKSSLVNQLVGFRRAIVNSMPGTTRDVLQQRTAISGWPVEITDTAGLRESINPIELKGIEKASTQIEQADVSIVVLDSSEPLSNEESHWIRQFSPDLIVFNKVDIGKVEHHLECDAIWVSAAMPKNIDQLVDFIGMKLSSQLPPSNQWFPVTHWQVQSLIVIKDQIQQRRFDEALKWFR